MPAGAAALSRAAATTCSRSLSRASTSCARAQAAAVAHWGIMKPSLQSAALRSFTDGEMWSS
jgi:hypothetical protein